MPVWVDFADNLLETTFNTVYLRQSINRERGRGRGWGEREGERGKGREREKCSKK